MADEMTDDTDATENPMAPPAGPGETAPAAPETAPADGIEKTGVEMVADGVERTTTLAGATPAPEPEPEAVALPHVAVGDIVHVALDRGPLTGECRPAIVVRRFGGAVVNVQMFSDGVNDHQDYAGGLVQLTGLHFALPVDGQPATPQTWHHTHE